MYDQTWHHANRSWRALLFTGISLLLGAIVVIAVPEILIALVAALLFFAGAALVSIAILLRRTARGSRSFTVHLL